MCTRGYLTRVEKDLSYLIWRSCVHQLSTAEISEALELLRSEVLKRCPENRSVCHIADKMFESHATELNELLERSKNNPNVNLLNQ